MMTIGRKKPLYYQSVRYCSDIFVLGHYESACGGCDTIGSARHVFDLTQTILQKYKGADYPPTVIIQEGLLLSEDVKWSSQLQDLRVIFLTTPTERCIEQIKGRRAEAGNEKPLNTANTVNRVPVIERARVKLNEMGVLCRRASSDQAAGIILKWIKDAK